jgi:hypothetical protein
MRHILLLVTVLFLSFNSFSQKNNLVIFSERGEKFVLIMNGLRQNAEPATNVKVVDLNQPGYVVKVIFEDKSIPDLDKKIPFNSTNMEVVAAIKYKKGVRKIAFVSEAPIIAGAPAVSNQQVVPYSPTGVSPESTITTTTTTTPATTEPVVVAKELNNNVTTTTNTTTTNPSGLSININDKGVSINAPGVNVNQNGTSTNNTVTTSSSSTNSSSLSSNNSSRYIANGTMCTSSSMTQQQLLKLKYDLDERTVVTKMRAAKETVQKNCMLSSQVAEIVKMFDGSDDQLDIAKYSYQYTYDTKNYDVVVNSLQHDFNKPKLVDFVGTSTNGGVSVSNGSTANKTTTTTTVVEQKVVTAAPTPVSSTSGCASPLSDSEFKTAKQSIASKSFEDTKLTIAKQVMKSKCLKTAQVKEIMGLFSFEDNKLDFAKAAYDYVYDKSNYYELSDAFTFETSIEELTKYVESKK